MDFVLGKRLQELSGPVLLTGHTGFKGTWLTLLLERLGVRTVGLSLAPQPNSLFDRMGRVGAIPETFTDIREPDAVQAFMEHHEPSAVIHLAAQPLVLDSYKTPRDTFETNIMGTVNVLSSSFSTKSVQVVGVITTDKVYRNDNSGRAFVESDPLEGKDPYSASKVGAESAVAAWQQISKVMGGPRIIALRAGNVIGGGDWADGRLMPDLIRGFSKETLVTVRNPKSTRPWQHVLDPLCGYVLALEALLSGSLTRALNFGPDSESMSVKEVVEASRRHWPSTTYVDFAEAEGDDETETIALHLDSTKAKKALGWKPRWNQTESVAATVKWWDDVLNRSINPSDACQFDIDFLLSN